jgi:uncharacterized membrane protein YhaH (DUF805 family)
MLKNLFSFEGRIRRSEYGISNIVFAVFWLIVRSIVLSDGGADSLILLVIIVLVGGWFVLAQGAKRCHDIGNSGWYQLIPFYSLLLLFQDGQIGTNQYGNNPKNLDGKTTSPSKENKQQSGKPDALISKNVTKNSFAFGKENYRILLVGVVVVVLGYLLMVGGGSSDPNQFHAEEIFSTRRITIAPITILVGFVIVLFAIMKKSKD